MSDATGEVISLTGRQVGPHLRTLGHLCDFAERIPQAQIMGRLPDHFRHIEALTAGDDEPALLRHMMVASVLLVRAIRELHGVPKRRAYRIDCHGIDAALDEDAELE